MYAIIETGGKQYKVQSGDVIFIEKLDVEADATITFDKNAGEAGDSANITLEYETTTKPTGAKIESLPTAQREGYVFVGWDIDTKNVTKDMIVVPIYEKIYDLNNIVDVDNDNKYELNFSIEDVTNIYGHCETIHKYKDNKLISLLEIIYYLLLLIITTSFLIDSSFNPFLYFRF